MQPADFKDDMFGRLLLAPEGYWAYVPQSLEPTIDLGLDLINKLSEADRALSELSGVARTLPNPHLLIGPFVRKEAVLSSRIEGTRTSYSDLLFFEAARQREKETADAQEVFNYVRALEFGLERMKELPISLRLLREIHEKLLAGVRGGNRTPGEFRRTQNWIGPPGCSLMEATYVPPPVPEMKDTLDDFEKYLHAESAFPPIVRLSLIHYQFEAIHPFLDGNGRIGRLLITLILCSEGLLPQPLLYLSAFFERHRNQYYDMLLAVSQEGNWSEWISFFLEAVISQSKDAIQRSDQLLSLWKSYRDKMQQVRASALLLKLIDELFTNPVTTNRFATETLSITPRSAQNNIEKLEKVGILKEITGRGRNRIYIAPEIIDIVEQENII